MSDRYEISQYVIDGAIANAQDRITEGHYNRAIQMGNRRFDLSGRVENLYIAETQSVIDMALDVLCHTEVEDINSSEAVERSYLAKFVVKRLIQKLSVSKFSEMNFDRSSKYEALVYSPFFDMQALCGGMALHLSGIGIPKQDWNRCIKASEVAMRPFYHLPAEAVAEGLSVGPYLSSDHFVLTKNDLDTDERCLVPNGALAEFISGEGSAGLGQSTCPAARMKSLTHRNLVHEYWDKLTDYYISNATTVDEGSNVLTAEFQY